MDRNLWWGVRKAVGSLSLSARRAWIEIAMTSQISVSTVVALRKESVDRNSTALVSFRACIVALRKESVDRNTNPGSTTLTFPGVALRKESVDRNLLS